MSNLHDVDNDVEQRLASESNTHTKSVTSLGEQSNLLGDEKKSISSFNHRKEKHMKGHLSFDAIFGAASDDNNDGYKASQTKWDMADHKKKRVFLSLGVVLVSIALLNLFIHPNYTSSSSNFNTTNVEKPCENNDPILNLKDSAAVERVKNGAVAADTELCSDVGLAILQEFDGNAVDAAVATALCLGVANPASSGIGGGGMILIHSDFASHKTNVNHKTYNSPIFHDEREDNDKREYYDLDYEDEKVTEFIDCREIAPSASSWDMFVHQSSESGGLSIGVPGELRGLELAHSRHGKLPWKDVVKPAMILARDGLKVSPYLAHEIQINEQMITSFPLLKKILTKNGDGVTFLKEGEIFKQPVLAETLKAIMNGGSDALYSGTRGEALAKDIQDAGGIITAQDLAEYRPSLRSPLIAHDVNGFTIVGAPPPSSGGAAIIAAARFLSGYHNPFSSFAQSLSQHRLVEACRHAFGIRMSLSDPKYKASVTAEAVNDMVQNQYMEELRESTRDNRTLPLSQYGGSKWAQLIDDQGQGEAKDANEGDRRVRRLDEQNSVILPSNRNHGRRFGYLEDHGTTHLSVIDKDRNAVSITSSVNTYFGSKVVSPSTGIILNNQMDDFATPGKPNHFGLRPSEANYIQPGKKPLSSMSPTMIFRPHEQYNNEKKTTTSSSSSPHPLGDIVVVLGASGGPKIISAVLQVFVNFAWRGMSLYESVTHPRLHDQLLYHGNAVTTWEKCHLLTGPTIEMPERTLQALEDRDHTLLPVSYMGTVQAISVDSETGLLSAVSDIRKGGKSKGY